MILTDRQLEILRLKKEGLTNKEIAERIARSESYVSQVLSRVAMKISSMEDTIQVLVQLGEFEDRPRYALTPEARMPATLLGWVKSTEPFRVPQKRYEVKLFTSFITYFKNYPDQTIVYNIPTKKIIYSKIDYPEIIMG